MLEKIEIQDFTLNNGLHQIKINLFYEIFGKKIGTAPVVLINHALTGNSAVSGKNGWWKELVGSGCVIDTNVFTIIAFNIPGNGFDGDAANLLYDYKNFSATDIARLFWKGLSHLKIGELFAAIGGSLGGGLAWEMAALAPNRIINLIPIATDYKATDWVIGHVLVQDQLLNNSENPIADARLHAMLLYRTPLSINQKFSRTKEAITSIYQVESWLLHHGVKLKNRFSLPAYKLMNHLLKTVNIFKESDDVRAEISAISANIHLIAIDSDLFFTADEIRNTYENLKGIKATVFYHEIKSIHGHDAFLIEYEQLKKILSPIFQT